MKSVTPYEMISRPGAGSHIGTLGGKVDHFSPAVRPGKAHTAPPRNFTTRPGKQGTGYG